MEHLLQKSKCSIFHNIFKYIIFQMCRKMLLWSKGLKIEFTFKHGIWEFKEHRKLFDDQIIVPN